MNSSYDRHLYIAFAVDNVGWLCYCSVISVGRPCLRIEKRYIVRCRGFRYFRIYRYEKRIVRSDAQLRYIYRNFSVRVVFKILEVGERRLARGTPRYYTDDYCTDCNKYIGFQGGGEL